MKKLYKSAFFFENPQWTNTQKSQISCGISCNTTAIVVANHTVGSTKKATHIMIQSIILWTISQTKFIHAKVFTSCVSSFGWIVFKIFSMINHIKIHHITEKDVILVNQYSSTASGKRCKKASHNKIPTENAMKHIRIFFNLAIGYPRVNTQITEIRLTIATAKIQYR